MHDDWKNFMPPEASLPSCQDADGDSAIKGLPIGFTISPPKRAYDVRLQHYIDLHPFVEMILDGSLVVFAEFDRKGRLHYHCVLKPVEGNDKFGLYARYLLCKSAESFQMQKIPVKMIIGYTKKGLPRAKKMNKCGYIWYRTQYYVELNVGEKYDAYIRKDATDTELILGYSQITPAILKAINTYVAVKFLIQI